MDTGSASRKRIHIVLIPGFGGFDALGNVEYYSGITQLFQAWKSARAVVLHYFDNLPTAAVATRSARLQSYLAKRMARGEILEGDDVVLVGHSTGGLDIRQLVLDLHAARHPIYVDGGVTVEPGEILARLRRVVFLSVPHWGTNIADWVHSHYWLRKAVVQYLDGAVTGSQLYLLDQVEQRIAGGAACLTGANILLACQDCLTEANERYGKPSPQRKAGAHEAAADLGLYLRDMASDFHVIDDLTSQPPSRGAKSPAHFDKVDRNKELRLWRKLHLKTLSFATVGHRSFAFAPRSPAPVWDLANPFTYRELLKESGLAEGTDISYRVCYRACAGGPLSRPAKTGRIRRVLGPAPPPPIELWDNDGIVNTVSMLWPIGEIVLVFADHLDILGHYHLVDAVPAGEGRKYQSYDSLKSASRFSQKRFEEVWTRVFDFCVGMQPLKLSSVVRRSGVRRKPTKPLVAAAALPK